MCLSVSVWCVVRECSAASQLFIQTTEIQSSGLAGMAWLAPHLRLCLNPRYVIAVAAKSAFKYIGVQHQHKIPYRPHLPCLEMFPAKGGDGAAGPGI